MHAASRELLQSAQAARIVTGTLPRVTSRRTFTVGIIGGGQLARMMHAAPSVLGSTRLLAEVPTPRQRPWCTTSPLAITQIR